MVSASPKHACPDCGAEATWNPGKHALICGSCGTESAAELKALGEIVEHDFKQGLASLKGLETGLARESLEFKCQSCQAISFLEPSRVAQNCGFCGSAALVPYKDLNEVIRPESLLPMKISEAKVREIIRSWYGTHSYAPNALGEKAMTDSVHGLYIPYWTFDAQVHADWTAESGMYTDRRRITATQRDGRRVRELRATRWSPASGELDHFFDDQLICGSKGVHPDLIRQVEPFPSKEAVPYDPGYLAGFVVERYQINLDAAFKASRVEMRRQTEHLCEWNVPGDTFRRLQTRQRYSAQTFKHILVPIWLLTYVYRGKVFQVVVNGYNGKIAGEYPRSRVKMFFAWAVFIGVILLILFLYLRPFLLPLFLGVR